MEFWHNCPGIEGQRRFLLKFARTEVTTIGQVHELFPLQLSRGLTLKSPLLE